MYQNFIPIYTSAVLCFVTQSCLTLCDPVHVDSPGSNTVVGCNALLPEIFPTESSHRQIIYHLSHQGSLRLLEWVAYPFSVGSSQSRN